MNHTATYVNSNGIKITVIGNVTSCSLVDSNFPEEPAVPVVRVETCSFFFYGSTGLYRPGPPRFVEVS